jgi:hypothetical protein
MGAQEDVISTRGDIVYGNSSGNATRLALGTSGQVLKSDGTDISWGTPPAPGAGTITRSKLSTSTVSLAGTIGVGGVNITLNAYAFFPMIHITTPIQYQLSGHSTDGSSADNPRLSLQPSTGKSGDTYDIDYRYIVA